jgi:hypothetical protein
MKKMILTVSLTCLFAFSLLFNPAFVAAEKNPVVEDQNPLKPVLDKVLTEAINSFNKIMEENMDDIQNVLKHYFSKVPDSDIKKFQSYDYKGNVMKLVALAEALKKRPDSTYELVHSFCLHELKVGEEAAKAVALFCKDLRLALDSWLKNLLVKLPIYSY